MDSVPHSALCNARWGDGLVTGMGSAAQSGLLLKKKVCEYAGERHWLFVIVIWGQASGFVPHLGFC